MDLVVCDVVEDLINCKWHMVNSIKNILTNSLRLLTLALKAAISSSVKVSAFAIMGIRLTLV